MGSLAYFGYGEYARSQLGTLSYEAERPTASTVSRDSATPPNELSGMDTVSTPFDALAIFSVNSMASASKTQTTERVEKHAMQVHGTTSESRDKNTSEKEEPLKGSLLVAQTVNQGQGSSNQPVEDTAKSRINTQGQSKTAILFTSTQGSQLSTNEGSTPSITATTPAANNAVKSTNGAGSAGAYAFAFGPGANTQDPAVLMTEARIERSLTEALTYAMPTKIKLTGDRGAATRIRIPAINLDTVVQDLQVVLTKESYSWETPKHVVGHIPTTGRPGTGGQGWYFGHLESPIRGEGNVFGRLPEIPQLAKGNPIFIFLETAGVKYAYKVYHTSVMHQDDLRITDSGDRDITLVTCTPRFYYDHRLLVTAALVGVREFGLEIETSS